MTQREVASVYRALAMPQQHPVPYVGFATLRAAILPRDADELELWVIAELLGGPQDDEMSAEEFEAQAAAEAEARARAATPEQIAEAARRAEALRLAVESSE